MLPVHRFAYSLRCSLVGSLLLLLCPTAFAGFPEPPKLAALSLESGSEAGGFLALPISPAFDPVANHLTYSATIPFEHTEVNVVTATAQDSFHAVESNVPDSFPANEVTPITISVADDPLFPFQTTIYTIYITRQPPSTTATLANLESAGATLTPPFDPLIFDYSSVVGLGITSLTFTPTALQTGSTITVNGAQVISGTAASIPLNLGDTPIVIRVTSQDQTIVKQYDVIVTRLDLDTDDDGMEDSWELENNLSVGTDDSLLDKDRDGLANQFEYAFGSDPCDPTDAARPVIGINGAGFGTISFFKAITDGSLIYTVQVSTHGDEWSSDVVDITNLVTPQAQVWKDRFGGNPIPPPSRLFRVELSSNL